MLLGLSGLLFLDTPASNRVIDYCVEPRINHSSLRKDLCLHDLENQVPWDSSSQFHFAPADFQIYHKRYELNQNPRVHALWMKRNPNQFDLDEVSYLTHGWAGLFPLKLYLLHHPDLAKLYRGLLPFGREVIAFYKKCNANLNPLSGVTPNYQDHLKLQIFTNLMATHLGITSVMINNFMYLEGRRLRVGEDE